MGRWMCMTEGKGATAPSPRPHPQLFGRFPCYLRVREAVAAEPSLWDQPWSLGRRPRVGNPDEATGAAVYSRDAVSSGEARAIAGDRFYEAGARPMSYPFQVLETACSREGRRDQDALTERRSMLSNLCLGTTVTSSISQRKATSEGVRPGGRGRAMLRALGRGWKLQRLRWSGQSCPSVEESQPHHGGDSTKVRKLQTDTLHI